MKIGILTHPLGSNYGGILQAWALSTYLKSQGHDVVVLNRRNNLSLFKRIVKNVLIAIGYKRYANPKYVQLERFVIQYINYSTPLSADSQMTNYVKRHGLDLVIVGSDQVWRPDFAKKYGFNYFLDFVPQGVKQASYAASFGLSDWGYNSEETRIIAQLLSKFVSVSVREDEAVKLCKDNLGIEVEHLLDPTLLLTNTDYDKIASGRKITEPYTYVYWLGSEEDKQKALSMYGGQNKIVEISLRGNAQLDSIEDWLSYIKYSENVITDSFHGCVFSIIYHKQFNICDNFSGGNGRLSSLIKMLNIDLNSDAINYDEVYKELESLKMKSLGYLNEILK